MARFLSSGPSQWSNRFSSPAFWLASGFGSGLLRPAPGTWGSVLAALIAWGLLISNPSNPGLLILGLALVTFAVGIWAVDIWQQETGDHDAGTIVIDEFAGIWIALFPLATEWKVITYHSIWLILGFLLFRFFDIVKPFPINWLDEHLPGALGVMVDDLVAGIISAIILFSIMCIYYIYL